MKWLKTFHITDLHDNLESACNKCELFFCAAQHSLSPACVCTHDTLCLQHICLYSLCRADIISTHANPRTPTLPPSPPPQHRPCRHFWSRRMEEGQINQNQQQASVWSYRSGMQPQNRRNEGQWKNKRKHYLVSVFQAPSEWGHFFSAMFFMLFYINRTNKGFDLIAKDTDEKMAVMLHSVVKEAQLARRPWELTAQTETIRYMQYMENLEGQICHSLLYFARFNCHYALNFHLFWFFVKHWQMVLKAKQLRTGWSYYSLLLVEGECIFWYISWKPACWM